MYNDHFGLRGEPFKFLASDILFRSGAHLEGLAALEWAYREPSGLTLLAGEVGTGKTMLIHALVTRLHDEHVRIAQINHPTLPFDEMLRIIVQQIGIHPVGKGKLAHLQAIKTFIADPASKARVILIFDEAQGLSDETLEELRLLSNSRPPQRHALQIIFVGQPELVQRLADPKLRALNQRIGARALLLPLRGSEIHDYVRYLLKEQGARYEIFSRRALDEVAELSDGLPRKINNLCHNALLHAYAERSTTIEPRHVRAAGAEIDNLLQVAELRGDHAIGSPRGAAQWMRAKRKFVMAAGVLALAVAALALEFAPGRPGLRFSHAFDTKASGGQTVASLAKPPSGSQVEGHKRVETKTDLAQRPQASLGAKPVVAAASRATTARPIVATNGAETAGGALTTRLSNIPQGKPATTGYAIPGPYAVAPASVPVLVSRPEAPPSGRKLTAKQEKRLEYDLRRGTASFEAGRYSNAIYHLERALAAHPGNPEIADLLQRARLAQSSVKSGSLRRATARAPVTENATETDNSEASPPVSNISVGTLVRVVNEELAEGDAYLRAGKYDSALRKFRTAAVLDPNNADIEDRIARAERAQTNAGNSSQ